MTTLRRLAGRRGAYRVRPRSLAELDMALLEKRYKVVRGRVADVAGGGALLEFDRALAPMLALGDRVMLALASDQHDFDHSVWARVVTRSERAEDVRIGFAFDDDALLPVPTPSFDVFNRRAIFRARAALGEHTVHACIRGDDGRRIEAEVRDFSDCGIGLAVGAEADPRLTTATRLMLELAWPAAGVLEQVQVEVRRCSVDGASAVYGCEFVWPGASDSPLLARLHGYVITAVREHSHLVPDRRAART